MKNEMGKGYDAQAKEIFDGEAFTMLIENDCNT